MGDRFLGDQIRVRQGARNLPGLRHQVDLAGQKISSLESRVAELEPLVRIDAKTKLLNESGMWHDIWNKCAEIRRGSEVPGSGEGLGFAFYDFIQFKTVNDGLGQNEGDKVINAAAQILRKEHRAEDGIVRYGGDEDLAIMKVRSEDELENILQASRVDRSGAPTSSLLDSVNAQMKDFLKTSYPDFVAKNGEMPGTFRSGSFFLTHDEIITTPAAELEEVIRDRLNVLSLRVKRQI